MDERQVVDVETETAFILDYKPHIKYDMDMWDEQPVFLDNTVIPTKLVERRIGSALWNSFEKEFGLIKHYYKIYKKGVRFNPDRLKYGSVTYVHATLRYKKVATLIDKQSRFLFGESPDIDVEYDGDIKVASDTTKQEISKTQKLLNNVFRQNLLTKQLMQASKDTFVGKRVACVINFNAQDGITLEFINSLRFVYETKVGNTNELVKFGAYTLLVDDETGEKKIKEKYYELVEIWDKDSDGNDVFIREAVFLSEGIYNLEGPVEDEELAEMVEIPELTRIPVVVITNDGLLEETRGVSDVEKLKGYEELYSKLSNADIDALRMGMNPIKYTIDMTNKSTKNLPVGPGAYWDLTGNWRQNDGSANPQIGIIEQNNTYSEALDTTLERIKASMYDELDIPDVTLSTLQGTITSGKALKAIYWGLIVRCKEKMKTWGPNIEKMSEIVIEGAKAFPDFATRYLDGESLGDVSYRIEVESNYPLPEDDAEEQELDMSKIVNGVMSRKTYIKRWQKLSDEEADEELKQIILEEAAIELAKKSAEALVTGDVSAQADSDIYKYFDPINGTTATQEAESVQVTVGE